MRANWILILTVSAALVGCGKSGTGGGYSTGQSSAGSTNAGSTAFPTNNFPANNNNNANNNTPAPRTPAPAPSTPAPAAPTVSAITPNNGDLAGGTTVMIDGTGLDTVTDVQIGGVSLTNLIVTPTEIQGVTGAAAQAGVADVVVFSPNGNATLAGAYTYNAPAPPPPPSLTYTNDIAPIIQHSGCLSCHAGSFPSGGVDLSSYNGVMQWVTPNDSANSQIVTTQQPGGRMAAQGTVMSSGDQAKLAQWIDAGAPQ